MTASQASRGFCWHIASDQAPGQALDQPAFGALHVDANGIAGGADLFDPGDRVGRDPAKHREFEHAVGDGVGGGGAPWSTRVTTTPLVKGHKNKGVSTITVTFSEAMADSAGASSSYSVVTPVVKRVHKKKVTKLVPVAFTSQRIASNQVKIQLKKPSKLVLQIIVRGTVTNAFGVEIGTSVTLPR